MRYIILLVSSLVCSEYAGAKCAYGGVYVEFPRPGQIAANSIFVIDYDRFNSAEEILRTEGNIYLFSEKDTVILEVIGSYETLNQYFQLVAKPKRALKVGQTYHIQVSGFGEYDTDVIDKLEFCWEVTASADFQPPRWVRSPLYRGNSVERPGCGPEKYAYFCSCISDSFQVAAIVQVKNITTGSMDEAIVVSRGGMFSIGHGMCGGPFRYYDSTNCEISFTLIDASGNRNADTLVPIQFASPNYNDSSAVYQCNCGEMKKDGTQDTADFAFGMIFFILLFTGGIVTYVILADQK